MTRLEHYFENLIYHGEDIEGDLNKNSLTEEEQNVVETCYYYVLHNLFGGRDALNEFLRGDTND